MYISQDLKMSYDSLMCEVPIVIKNSHLMNALLLELQEQLPLKAGGSQFLDLGTTGNWFNSLFNFK